MNFAFYHYISNYRSPVVFEMYMFTGVGVRYVNNLKGYEVTDSIITLALIFNQGLPPCRVYRTVTIVDLRGYM